MERQNTMNDKMNADPFNLLSRNMKKWVSLQGWSELRPIQSKSIEALLNDDAESVLISAGTASGKTEAAFLPSLSLIEKAMNNDINNRTVQMLYVAPLKALINDQHRRMTLMARDFSFPITLWHGDAPQSGKNRMIKEHSGILMITPESLESLLMRKGKWCSSYLKPMIIVIDEFHSFVGESRGKQLLSLLHRIDSICDFSKTPRPRRIGLSATLSQLKQVADILTGGRGGHCVIIDGRKYGTDESKITVKCFQPISHNDHKGNVHDEIDMETISKHIIKESGNNKTLTFARSRKEVEDISVSINKICDKYGIKSKAFPHHGSLSKETREALENRLVNTDKPTMAIATITLELGIDIGDIAEVFQINSTNTVASLRQRMGRSGRRDGFRRLDCLVTLSSSEPTMQPELTNTISEIELMEQGWFEPPRAARRDLSVLVSETLSVLTQYGSAYEDEIYNLLCSKKKGGAFANIDQDLFSLLIYDMKCAEFITEDVDGTLMIGKNGEKEVEDWKFYATFQSEESYTVRNGQKKIGEITPPDTALNQLSNGGAFLLGGKAWKVVSIDFNTKNISVTPTSAKASFLIPISRGKGDISGRIKRERLSLLNGRKKEYVPEYLDDVGKESLESAREYARIHHLNGLGVCISPGGGEGSSETPTAHAARCAKGYTIDAEVSVMPPVDSPAGNAIIKLLEMSGMEPGGLERIPLWRLADLVSTCMKNMDSIKANRLALIDKSIISDLRGREKYNYIMSDETLCHAYMYELFDIEGACEWFEAFERFIEQRVS